MHKAEKACILQAAHDLVFPNYCFLCRTQYRDCGEIIGVGLSSLSAYSSNTESYEDQSLHRTMHERVDITT
jgi:hypothetical protein